MTDRDIRVDGLACSRVGGARVSRPTGAAAGNHHGYDPEEVNRAVGRALWRMRDETPRTDDNPLCGIVRPGDRVVIKPNLIRSSRLAGEEWIQVITHPQVTESILHLAAQALQGRGEIVITDGPQTDSSFAELMRITGLDQRAERASRTHGVPVRVLDLRQEEWQARDGVVVSKQALPGDPLGYGDVDLGANSAFAGHAGGGRYYGAAFDTRETNGQHTTGRHRYRLSGTVLACDLLINVPKLKTHKKAGITASLKNLVGVNGNKNWLPHYTLGFPSDGGDQYPSSTPARRAESSLVEKGKALLSRRPALARALVPVKGLGRRIFGDTAEVVRSGNWHGNDTIWRMILDLNRAVLMHGPDGQPLPAPRRYLSLVDAVVMGEGRGPEDPDALWGGWVLAGSNPVAVDAVGATLMGFDWRRVPAIARAFDTPDGRLAPFSPDDILFKADDTWPLARPRQADVIPARPHFGWAGHIETATGRRAAS